MASNSNKLSVVMLGASGATGTEALQTLLKSGQTERLTLLGRTPIAGIEADFVRQHIIDILDARSYAGLLAGHDVAICTLGVGQPSKMSREEFLKIDKTAVLDFARACKNAGVAHFELLASVGIDAQSASFYLRSKGELADALMALDFVRLSIFQPSMILTPVNRYGFGQAATLLVWPLLKPLLLGGWRKYRGIPVEVLGQSIALNIFTKKSGVERLHWDDFYALAEHKNA
jgi:uncharacterized protein YbjT (DUF2867 family)